jgi:hypothetical protein
VKKKLTTWNGFYMKMKIYNNIYFIRYK